MKNPRWDHKKDYDFLENEQRLEVWAWEILKRNDEYREDYKSYMAKKEELGEDNSDWKITVTNYRPKYVHGYDPPKNLNESEQAWRLRCAEQGIVSRILSLSGHYGLKWGLMGMYAPDMLHDEGVAFSKRRKFPQLIERYDDLDSIPVVEIGDEEWAENMIHQERGVIVFDLSRSITPQMESAHGLLEARAAAFQVKAAVSFGESKGRWLNHCRVKDALDLNPQIGRVDLAMAIVGEKKTSAETSKAGYDLIRQAKAFFKKSKHMSILMGVDVDKNSELKE